MGLDKEDEEENVDWRLDTEGATAQDLLLSGNAHDIVRLWRVACFVS